MGVVSDAHSPWVSLTLEVFGVLDVDFLVQFKCLLVVPHPAEAARNHQTPLHLGEQTRGGQLQIAFRPNRHHMHMR